MADDVARLTPLTIQQMKVLRLAADGDSNRVIAEKLFLSEHTVKTHIGRMLKAWQVGSRNELVTTAYRIGVLSCANCESHESSRRNADAVTALAEGASAALRLFADALLVFAKETGGGPHG